MPSFFPKNRLWFVLVFFLLGGILWWYSATSSLDDDPNAANSFRKGASLSSKTPLITASGDRILLEEFQGKVLLLNFWASWCAPCITEMPSIYSLQKKFEGRGFAVVAVSMDDDVKAGIEKLERLVGPIPFLVVKGHESAIADQFSVSALPYSVVVDKEGKIHYAQFGELDWTHPDAVRMIEGLL